MLNTLSTETMATEVISEEVPQINCVKISVIVVHMSAIIAVIGLTVFLAFGPTIAQTSVNTTKIEEQNVGKGMIRGSINNLVQYFPMFVLGIVEVFGYFYMGRIVAAFF